MDFLFSLPPVAQAVLATLLTYLFTMLGAGLVLLFRNPRRVVMDLMLALGAGIMLASAFWSLLAPAIDLSDQLGQISWVIGPLGFLAGVLLIAAGDALYRRLTHTDKTAAPKSRSRLLITAITLHNIPEGLAVGVAFGALALTPTPPAVRGAWLLALGIAIQNFPEGAAVSLPLRRDGFTPIRAFTFGHLSGLVEPIAGLIGVLLASTVQGLLPFLLAFAGGAMIYVVISELIPEFEGKSYTVWMNAIAMLGFAVMMVLDVAFQ